MSDGYISDVPTHHSNAASEISQDLIASTKVLESHFKEKYQILRKAYEQRIKQLSDVIQNMCSAFYADELLQQMKNDKTSALFIPSHLNEVIDHHLQSEREKYVQELLLRTSSLELELNQAQRTISIQQEELRKKTESTEMIEKQCKQKLSAMKQSLQLKNEECDQLKLTLEQKVHQIDILEQSYEQNSRELAIIEGLDKKEQNLKMEMKEQVTLLSRENHSLKEHLQQLTLENQLLSEKYQANQTIIHEQTYQNDLQKQKISSLIHQIEDLFEQEMNESNQIILSTNEKLKIMKNKFSQQLSKEKRFSKALEEELTEMKLKYDNISKEKNQFHEFQKQFQLQNHSEQQQLLSLQQENSKLQFQLKESDRMIHELEMKNKNIDQQIYEKTKLLEKEMEIKEQKIRTEILLKTEEDRRLLEQQANLLKLQYENKFQLLRQEMKNSYSFIENNNNNENISLENQLLRSSLEGGGGDGSDLVSSSLLLSNNFHNIQDEIHFRKIIQQLTKEKELLIKKQIEIKKVLTNEIENQFNEKLETMKISLEKESNQQINEFKKMLNEASLYIDKLKIMVKDGKSVIAMQNDRIEQLKNQVFQLQNESLQLYKGGGGNGNPMNSSVLSSQNSVGSSTVTPRLTINPNNNNTRTPKTGKTVKLYSPHSFDQLQQQNQFSQRNDGNSHLNRSYNDMTSVTSFSEQNTYNSIHQRNNSSSMAMGESADELRSYHDQQQSFPQPNNSSNNNYQSSIVTDKTPRSEKSIGRSSVATPKSSLKSQASQRDASVRSSSDQQQQQQMMMMSSVMEEARQTKQMNLQLQEQKEILEQKIFQLETQLQKLLEQKETSTRKSRASSSRNISSSSAGPRSLSANSFSIEMDERIHLDHPQDDDNHHPPQQQQQQPDDSSTLPSTSFTHQQQLEEDHRQFLLHDQEQQCDALSLKETGMNTLPNPELIELYQTNEQLSLTIKSLRDSLSFEKEQSSIYQEQYEKEKQLNLQQTKQILFLQNILRKCSFEYKTQLQELRNNLSFVKNSFHHFQFFMENEKQQTSHALLLQLQILLKVYENNLDSLHQKKQKKFVSIYSEEKEIVEARYQQQLQEMKKKYEKEIEQVHLSYRSMDKNHLQPLTSSTTTAAVSVNNNRATMSVLPQQILVAAFESTLTGTMQGLIDQQAISLEIHQKIMSLAKAHHEPSYAATAAARALIGEEIDKFMVKLLQRKYADEDFYLLSPSVYPAAALTSSQQQQPQEDNDWNISSLPANPPPGSLQSPGPAGDFPFHRSQGSSLSSQPMARGDDPETEALSWRYSQRNHPGSSTSSSASLSMNFGQF